MVEIDEETNKSLKEMFEEIFKDFKDKVRDYDFEKELENIVKCISNQRWAYYSSFDDKNVKKEVYVKAGTIFTSTMGEHDYGVKISYKREGNKMKNGLIKIAFDCGFLKYSFENKSCILQEIQGKVDENIISYELLLYDLPEEVLIEMGF